MAARKDSNNAPPGSRVPAPDADPNDSLLSDPGTVEVNENNRSDNMEAGRGTPGDYQHGGTPIGSDPRE